MQAASTPVEDACHEAAHCHTEQLGRRYVCARGRQAGRHIGAGQGCEVGMSVMPLRYGLKYLSCGGHDMT